MQCYSTCTKYLMFSHDICAAAVVTFYFWAGFGSFLWCAGQFAVAFVFLAFSQFSSLHSFPSEVPGNPWSFPSISYIHQNTALCADTSLLTLKTQPVLQISPDVCFYYRSMVFYSILIPSTFLENCVDLAAQKTYCRWCKLSRWWMRTWSFLNSLSLDCNILCISTVCESSTGTVERSFPSL